jgi:hypothetical protein
VGTTVQAISLDTALRLSGRFSVNVRMRSAVSVNKTSDTARYFSPEDRDIVNVDY